MKLKLFVFADTHWTSLTISESISYNYIEVEFFLIVVFIGNRIEFDVYLIIFEFVLGSQMSIYIRIRIRQLVVVEASFIFEV